MSVLIEILTAILRALIPALVQSSPDTAEDGRRDPVLKGRLDERIKATWGKAGGTAGALLCLCLLCGGCWIRTVYVPHGEPVRLREKIRDAAVWALDADGKPVAGKMTLPEGWYALPDPGK